MPVDLDAILHRTAPEPSGPLDVGLLMERARRRRRRTVLAGASAPAVVAVLVAAVVLPAPPSVEFDRSRKPEVADAPDDPRTATREVEFVVLAAVAAEEAAATGAVALDDEALTHAWARAGAISDPPPVPEDRGVVVVTVGSSTCRSREDVVGLEVVGDRGVVVLAADGQFSRPCPGPLGTPRATVYAVAVAGETARGLTEVTTRVEAGASEQP